MIFKKIFAPSYTHTDPNKRIASLEKLDPNNDKDKSIIHELAFNDENDSVRIAALKRLNSFAIWVKTADTAHSVVIKKIARQHCFEQVENPKFVDDKLFSAYIRELKSKNVLESLLFNSVRLQADTQLSLHALFKLDSQSAVKRFFQEKANTEQQLAIIEKTNEIKILVRFAKQSREQVVLSAIDKKIEHLSWLQAQPAKVKQRAVLLNSQMLSLKDMHDYAALEPQFKRLLTEFETLKTSFVHLTELEASDFSSKFLALKNDVQVNLKRLEAGHKQQQAHLQFTQEIDRLRKDCEQVDEQISLCASELESDIEAQLKILQGALQTAREGQSTLSEMPIAAKFVAELSQLAELIDKTETNLANLPATILLARESASLVKQAEILVEQYEQLVANTEASHQSSASNSQKGFIFSEAESASQLEKEFYQLQTLFNVNIQNASSALPKQIKNAFSKQKKRVNALSEKYYDSFKQLERKIEQKLRIVNHLISDGKYKSAISTFHHVQKLLAQLPDESIGDNSHSKSKFKHINNAIKRLLKTTENTAEEVAKLKDWQSYVAQPRKPELIKQAAALAKSECKDAYKRAEDVKQIRLEWNSFGKLHTPEDDALNTEFDSLLSIAFEPCRQFFAKLDAEREANAVKAQNIIEKAKSLQVDSLDEPLGKVLAQLRQEFKDVGDLDKKLESSLKREFNKVIRPLGGRVDKEHQENAAKKARLVKSAEKLNDLEDINDAVNEAKKLQQEWQKIGFAGKTNDNKLWQSFREHNDAVFAKFHKIISEKHAEQDSIMQLIESEIEQISLKVNTSRSNADLAFFDERYQALLSSADGLSEKHKKKVNSKLQKLTLKVDSTVSRFKSQQQNQAYEKLFTFLHHYDESIDFRKHNQKQHQLQEQNENGKVQIPLNSLSNKFVASLKGEFDRHDFLLKKDRTGLIIVLFLLHDKPLANALVAHESLKKTIQLELMAATLEGHDMPTSEDVLAHWLALGPLSDEDRCLLPTLSSFFLTEEKQNTPMTIAQDA